MLGHRFIRWASVYPVLKESSTEALTSLLRHDTPVPVGSSGAEDFASARLTCSLVHPPRLLRCSISTPSDHPVPLGFLHIASHPCNKLHRCLYVGLFGANRIDRCLCIGSSGATGFCRTRPFQSFLSSFFVFCYAWPFSFIHGIY